MIFEKYDFRTIDFRTLLRPRLNCFNDQDFLKSFHANHSDKTLKNVLKNVHDNIIYTLGSKRPYEYLTRFFEGRIVECIVTRAAQSRWARFEENLLERLFEQSR